MYLVVYALQESIANESDWGKSLGDWVRSHRSGSVLIITCILILCFGIIFPWIIGYRKTNRLSWLYGVHKKYRELVPHASIILASSIVLVSMIVAFFFLHPTDTYSDSLITSSGFIYSITAAIFTVWAFLNTMILRSSQEERIVDIPHLLVEATAAINKTVKDLRDNKDVRCFYMLDYAPGIGIRYATAEDDRFRNALESLFRDPGASGIRVEAVFYTDEFVESFHRNIGATDREITIVKDTIYDLDNPVHSKGAIWTSTNIGALHCMLVDNIVFQYIVIPEQNGTKSKAIGVRSEDVFLISFLKEMVEGTIRTIITPKCRLQEPDFILDLPSQPNISKVSIYLSFNEKFHVPYSSDDKPAPDVLHIERDWPVTTPYQLQLTRQEIQDNRYLKIVMIKKNGVRSLASNTVEIPHGN